MVQGEAATYIDVNIRSEKLEKDASKAADSFSKRIEKAVSGTLGNFSPVGAGSSGGGSAIATGVAAGLAAGGVIALLDILVKTLADFPIISGIMKMFKVILTLLLMPLVPILKPVLMALGEFVKWFAPLMTKLSGAFDKLLSGDILGGLKGIGDVLGAIILGALADIGKLTVGILEWVGKATYELFKDIGIIIFSIFEGLKNIGILIWENIIKPAFNILLSVGRWIWEQIIKPGLSSVANFGTWIWDFFVKGLKDIASFGTWIWTKFTDGLKVVADFGTWIWNIIKSPFDLLVSFIKSAYNYIADSKIGQYFGMKRIDDGIVQNGNVISTSPQDYIIATKNPQSLGGNKSITINVTGNTFGNRSDIDYLTREITRNFRAEMRASGR